MAQYVCPKVVYFNYFTSVFSSLFFPSHNLIMSLYIFIVVRHIEAGSIKKMLCIPEEEGLQPIEERMMELLYQTMSPTYHT